MAVSRHLAPRSGHTLVLAGRDRDRLEDIVRQCSGDPKNMKCHGFAADLSQETDVTDLFAKARESGPVTEWVHCVGVELPGPVSKITGAAVEITVAVHLLSTVFAAREFLQNWNGQTPITWVWVGSRRARLPSPDDAVYAAAKAAVASLARSVREEVSSPRFRLTVLEPARIGNTDNAGSAPKRTQDALSPDDVAAAIAWLLALPDTVEVSSLEMRHPGDLHPTRPAPA